MRTERDPAWEEGSPKPRFQSKGSMRARCFKGYDATPATQQVQRSCHSCPARTKKLDAFLTRPSAVKSWAGRACNPCSHPCWLFQFDPPKHRQQIQGDDKASPAEPSTLWRVHFGDCDTSVVLLLLLLV